MSVNASKSNYETKCVLIICFISAYVWFDRNALAFMAPFIMKDLNMTATQLGTINSAFAVSWAISGMLGSAFADKYKMKKRLLMLSLFLFAAMSFLSGLAHSFLSLILIRVILGLFEGPTFPIGQGLIFAVSAPHRRGRNMGLMQTTFPNIFANWIGPILITAICLSIGWRNTFFFTFIPGIFIFLFALKILKEPETGSKEEASAKKEAVPYRELLKYRNVKLSLIICPLMVAGFLAYMAYATVYYTMATDYSESTVSFIVSVFGIGGIFYGVIVTGLSDKFGRKPVAITFMIISLIGILGILTVGKESLPILVISVLLLATTAGCMVTYQATIPAESVPEGISSSSIGLCNGFGELIGGLSSGIIVGILIDRFGPDAMLYFMIVMYAIAIVLTFFMEESAPSKAKKTLIETA